MIDVKKKKKRKRIFFEKGTLKKIMKENYIIYMIRKK
jgi:hypothetical protein